MRILFTLIAILFFSFNNANARLNAVAKKDIMIKGEVIAYFQDIRTSQGISKNKTIIKIIVMRYQDEVYECRIFEDYFNCKILEAFE